MSDTFCGKSCLNCTYKESLACHGCKSKLGDALIPDCTLANCCTEKAYTSCSTCNNFATCSAVYREGIPSRRLHTLVTDAGLLNTSSPKETPMYRYFQLLFVFLALQIACDILSNGHIVKISTSIHTTVSILIFMIPVIYAILLLILSEKNDLYRIAGGCMLADIFISEFATTLPVETHTLGWLFSLLMISLGCALYGTHREFHAHSELLKCINYTLSEKWQALWKWYLITSIVLYGSVFLIILLPNFAILLTLAGLLGNVAVNIIKLLYLYQTATSLRDNPNSSFH